MAVVQVTYHRVVDRLVNDLRCPCGWHEKVAQPFKRDVEHLVNRHLATSVSEILAPSDPRARRALRMLLAPEQTPWRS